MADLDDFFAQKDRAKKSKGKKTSGIIIPGALNPEEEVAQKETPSVKQESKRVKDPILNVKIGDEDEGEWQEIDYEKDYSGLKIQSLNIKDKEEEMREQKLQEASDQMEIKMSESGGPWKTSQIKTTDDSDAEEEESKEDKSSTIKAEPSVTVGGKYIPPSMRNQGMSSSPALDASQPVKLSALRGRSGLKAPSIANQAEFPSLGE